MRILAVVVTGWLGISVAVAAPARPKDLAAADRLRATAGRAEPEEASAAWVAAGQAYEAVRATADDPAVAAIAAQEAAWAFVRAVPEPPAGAPGDAGPPRARSFGPDAERALAAIARVADLAVSSFLRAELHRRHGQLAEAVPHLDTVIARADPRDDLVGTAATLLLDALVQLGDRAALDDRLRGIRERPALLHRREELRATVTRLWTGLRRGEAEALEQAARQGDATAWLRCAEAYRSVYEEAPPGDDAAAALYNAGVCYAQAGATAVAMQLWRRLVELRPTPSLAGVTYVRLGTIHAQVGQYAEAARDLAAAAELGGAHAGTAANQAVFYALAAGDRALARRALAAVAKAMQAMQPDPARRHDLALGTLAVVAADLATCRDAGCRRRLGREAAASVGRLPVPAPAHDATATRAPTLALAHTLALVELTCPTPTDAGVCGRPRQRWIGTARRHLEAHVDARAHVQRLALDAETSAGPDRAALLDRLDALALDPDGVAPAVALGAALARRWRGDAAIAPRLAIWRIPRTLERLPREAAAPTFRVVEAPVLERASPAAERVLPE